MPASSKILELLSACSCSANQGSFGDGCTVRVSFDTESQAKAFVEAFKAHQIECVPSEEIEAYEISARLAHSAQIKCMQARSKLPIAVRKIVDERLTNERDPA